MSAASVLGTPKCQVCLHLVTLLSDAHAHPAVGKGC
jgi:hypothetical protein